MIKFKYAIHKPTKTKIGYNYWKTVLDEKLLLYFNEMSPVKFYNGVSYMGDVVKGIYKYKPIDILLSDDFEIIYETHIYSRGRRRELPISEESSEINETDVDEILKELPKETQQYYYNSSIYNKESCKQCPNNPSNGGSGTCNCTLATPIIT